MVNLDCKSVATHIKEIVDLGGHYKLEQKSESGFSLSIGKLELQFDILRTIFAAILKMEWNLAAEQQPSDQTIPISMKGIRSQTEQSIRY